MTAPGTARDPAREGPVKTPRGISSTPRHGEAQRPHPPSPDHSPPTSQGSPPPSAVKGERGAGGGEGQPAPCGAGEGASVEPTPTEGPDSEAGAEERETDTVLRAVEGAPLPRADILKATGLGPERFDGLSRTRKFRHLVRLRDDRLWEPTPAGRERLKRLAAARDLPSPLRQAYDLRVEQLQVEERKEDLLDEIAGVEVWIEDRSRECEGVPVDARSWSQEVHPVGLRLKAVADTLEQARSLSDIAEIRSLVGSLWTQAQNIWRPVGSAIRAWHLEQERARRLKAHKEALQRRCGQMPVPPDWFLLRFLDQVDQELFVDFVFYAWIVRRRKRATPQALERAVRSYRNAGPAYLKRIIGMGRKLLEREARRAVRYTRPLSPWSGWIPFFIWPQEDKQFLLQRLQEGDDLDTAVFELDMHLAYQQRLVLHQQGYPPPAQWQALAELFGPFVANAAMGRALPFWMAPPPPPMNWGFPH